MRCPRCAFEHPDGVQFCTECGAGLGGPCPGCGFENRPGAKFCGQCATPLTGASPPGAGAEPAGSAGGPPPPAPRSAAAERRQLTVMFCDLVGSTALSIALDPEEMREVLTSYQEACATVIARYEGLLARYLGDGLLVYFGYPLAHEDDARRAVYAGLGIVEAIAQLNVRLRSEWGITLAVRIGISTGLVVIGEMGSGEQRETDAVVGEVPIVASRLQEIAGANGVVLSPSTYRLVEGYFECWDLGEHELKGLLRPLRVFQVVGETGAHSRLDVAGQTGMTRPVGRQRELALLLERWERATTGAGQVVLIEGESGIGKSRQLRMLAERLTDDPHFAMELRCSAYHANSAFHPVVEHLQRSLGLDQESSPARKLARLEAALARFGLSRPETVSLVASLLSIPLGDRYQPLDLTPQRQRQDTIESLLAWLRAMAARRPVLFTVEDLHWVDPSTLELLGLLVERETSRPLLSVFTFRPEFRPPWPPREHVTEINLGRLTREQTLAMIGHVTGDKPLPPDLVAAIAARTEGVPLFVEELTKMVVESDLVRETPRGYELARPLEPLAIPATLQDSLMARLDRLSTAKPVAQLGATLGREFEYAVLEAVSPLDGADVRRELDRLTDAQLIYATVPPPEIYAFRHALIQDAAYQSLLRRTRQDYHLRIAEVLERQFPAIAERQPELLAHHFAAGGRELQAVTYWQRAGRRALERSAISESIAHLQHGLDLVERLPRTPETAEQELLLLTTLGPALITRMGFGASEVGETYDRARQLCQQLGQLPQVFPALWGLWVFHLVRGDLRLARELAEDMLRLGEQAGDSGLLIEAHWTLGDALFWLGELESARDHLERAVAHYDPARHPAHAFLFGQDPGVAARCYLAYTLWHLGEPDDAVRTIDEAIRSARRLSHPFTLGWALACGAMVHEWNGDPAATRELAEAVIQLCTEQMHPFWLSAGMILRGWALTRLGEPSDGIAQMREGLAAYGAIGSGVVLPHFLGLLAEALAEHGDRAESEAVLDEALALADRNEERVSEIGLRRLQAKLRPTSQGTP